MIKHEQIEKSVTLLIVLTLLVVLWGGLLEIVPLFFQKSTTTPVEGTKPYDAVRLAGRDVYIREGCFLCSPCGIVATWVHPMRNQHGSSLCRNCP
jgi:cytochrome c oxidase cbb3-type subunit 2